VFFFFYSEIEFNLIYRSPGNNPNVPMPMVFPQPPCDMIHDTSERPETPYPAIHAPP